MSASDPSAQLRLFGRTDCHLCNLAQIELQPLVHVYGYSLKHTDITGDADLEQRYGLRIPVVRTGDGREYDWPFRAAQILNSNE